MKLINPSTCILQPNGYTMAEVLKFITLVAYTCYKTDKVITDDSASEFVNKLKKSGHLAMLEHGTIYLKIPHNFLGRMLYGKIVNFYSHNKYSKVNFGYEKPLDVFDHGGNQLSHSNTISFAYITTNLRVIEENQRWDDLEYICEPSDHHAMRRTVKFITDRGVSHELVRHRVFSFAQESTRYCNYGKDKFGSEITFIEPTWYNEAEGVIKSSFESFLKYSEDAYMDLLDHQYTPQQARQVLPNALKTEVVLTAFESDWVHFFNLRSIGTTGRPHPDMQALATPLLEDFLEEFPTFQVLFNEYHSTHENG